MAQAQPNHPQVTKDQIEIWLQNPVTQVYLQSLQWFHEELVEHQGRDGQVDSTSSDVTFAATHINMGQKQGLVTAINYNSILERFGMIEPEKKEDAA